MIDNVGDMTRCLDLCDERKVVLPRFVIFEPDEAAVVLCETTATFVRKFNELSLKINNLVDSEMLRVRITGFKSDLCSSLEDPPRKILTMAYREKTFNNTKESYY